MSTRPAILLLLSIATVSALDAITMESVVTRRLGKEELTSVSEIFGAPEQAGGRCFLRSNPAEKAGLYFVVDFDSALSSLPEACTVKLEMVLAADGKEQTLELPLKSSTGHMGNALYLGLTDSALRDADILAWRIRLLDSSGNTLAARHSYLWEMPAR